MSTTLSNNAISSLMQLPINTTHKNLNLHLQLIHLNITHISKSFHTAILCDNIHKYCGFIIKQSSSQIQLPSKGDILNILEIFITEKKPTPIYKIFIITNYIIIHHTSIPINVTPYIIPQESTDTDKDKSSNTNKEDNNDNNNNNNNNDEADIISNNSNTNSNECIIDEHIEHTNDNKILCPVITNISEIPNFMYLSSLTSSTKDIILYVKIIKKCEIKTFFNKVTQSKSKLLSFDICDSSGYEMQVSIFDRTCDKMAASLYENEIYIFKGGYAKRNDKKYTNIKSEYKLIFDMETEFMHVPKEIDTYFNSDFKRRKKSANLVLLKDLYKYDNNTVIDALVYVIEAYPKSVKQSRVGEVVFKRVIVGDVSGIKCEFTMWKKFADLNIKTGMIMFLNYIRINEYNGIRLSTVDDSNIVLDPKDEEGENEVEKLEEFVVQVLEESVGLVWKDLNQYVKEVKCEEKEKKEEGKKEEAKKEEEKKEEGKIQGGNGNEGK